MLSDWDLYKSDASNVIGIDPVTPLVGAGSLVMGKGPSINNGRSHLLPKNPGTWTPVGVLRGAAAITCQVPTSFTVDTGAPQYFGIIALCETVTVNAVGQAVYAFLAEARTSGVLGLSLRYFPDGLATNTQASGLAPSNTPLWSAVMTPSLPLGTVFTMEFEWEASSEYGGTRLIARKGSATGYSDLVTLVDMIHPLTPIPTTCGRRAVYGLRQWRHAQFYGEDGQLEAPRVTTYRGQEGFLSLGGYLAGYASVASAVLEGATQLTILGAQLTGVVLPGDTFTVDGAPGTYTVQQTVVAVDNQLVGVPFSPSAPAGGFAVASSVLFNAHSIAETRGWTATNTLQILETTVQGHLARTRRTGLVEWQGTFEGFFDYGDPAQATLMNKFTQPPYRGSWWAYRSR